jgi:hypothetical protein
MLEANHKVREACMICEGSGGDCAHCQGTGTVYALMGRPGDVLLATGDCKRPMRKVASQPLGIERKFS